LNVGSLLTANAARFPKKWAIVEGGKRVSYCELNFRVNRLANRLCALNLKKGDKVSLHLKNSIEFAEAYFALSKLGVVIVPINWRLKGMELLHIVKHSDSVFLFFDETTRENVESLRADLDSVKKIFVGSGLSGWYELYEELFNGSEQEPSVEVSEDDNHSICYSSGTTGLPKGIVLTNLNIITGHYYVTSAEFGITHDDIFLITTPLTQRIGWGKLINSIALGSTLILAHAFRAEEAMQIVEKEKVTILSMIPTIGRLILELPSLESFDTRALRMFFVTGEAFSTELKRSLAEKFPHVKIVSYFASTEAAIVSSMSHEDVLVKPASVGHLLPGVEVKILDEQGREVPPGEVGEIVTRCGKPGVFSLMKEYYKDPIMTREAFLDGWLKTGDMGRFDEEGYLYIVDRKNDMIISGGFNIYSREVEVILESNEKVAEAAVIGVPDGTYGEAIKAFIVLKPGAVATGKEIIEYCKANIASYKKPKYIEFIDALPRNAVGKVLKYQLKDKERAKK
jgi:long-chain acyl-CoA synthetase